MRLLDTKRLSKCLLLNFSLLFFHQFFGRHFPLIGRSHDSYHSGMVKTNTRFPQQTRNHTLHRSNLLFMQCHKSADDTGRAPTAGFCAHNFAGSERGVHETLFRDRSAVCASSKRLIQTSFGGGVTECRGEHGGEKSS